MPFDTSVIGSAVETFSLSYRWQDVVLYALGIGAKADELDYLYEGRGPHVFPTFAVAPGLDPVVRLVDRAGGTGSRRVHSAQSIRVVAPIPPEGKIEITARVTGVFDHQKFATVVIDTTSTNAATGAVLVEGTWTFLFPEGGGFGGAAPPKAEKVTAPERAPDFAREEASLREQAILYRLNGDLNPLHLDPEIAKSKGFPEPILQGLCTFGFMMRAAARGAGTNVASLRTLSGQFRRPALPGDVFVTEGWKLDDGRWTLGLRANGRPDPLIAAAIATFG